MADSNEDQVSILSAVFEDKADTKDEAGGLLRKNGNIIPEMIGKVMTW